MGTPNPPGILEPWMLWQSLAAPGWSWPACAHGAGRVPRKGSACPSRGQGATAWPQAPINAPLAVLCGAVSGDGGGRAACAAHGVHAWHARGCLGKGWHHQHSAWCRWALPSGEHIPMCALCGGVQSFVGLLWEPPGPKGLLDVGIGLLRVPGACPRVGCGEGRNGQPVGTLLLCLSSALPTLAFQGWW